jgi:hypothetical protein
MKTLLLFTMALLCSGFYLSAQDTQKYFTKRTESSPRINGLFDDEAWKNVTWQGDFIQWEPDNGAAAAQQTAFAILYDDVNVYVAIQCFDTEADKIESRLARRDEWEGDLIAVSFDSYNDDRTGFFFMVNAAGVKIDGIIPNDRLSNLDDTMDPIWHVKTKIHAEGWNAEMKIPLSQLRFSDKEKQLWGVSFQRKIFREDEWSSWPHIPNSSSGFVSEFGELHGIENINPLKQVEIAPFIVAKTEFYEAEEGNPFKDGTDLGFTTGVDGKIGITNDLILDFAINPDFGQVEADPSEVNLSAFESFFEEKRPFFIEGKNITNFQLTPGGSPWSSDNLFYSRRIGRRPHGSPDIGDNEFIKRPSNSRILGAFKLTGKTQKGWSVGIIESITNREKALIDNDGEQRKESVEPLTNYFIARVQKDINKGNTLLGGMLTSTYRDIDNEDLLFLPKSAITAGIDFTQYFKDRTYFISASLGTSQVTGDKWAIQELQKSPRRLFQRPDADYLTYDADRTSLAGTGGTLSFGKIANAGFTFAVTSTWRSPGFELNDVGFLRSGNNFLQDVWLSYKVQKPFLIFRSLGAEFVQWTGFDFGGTNLFIGGNIGMNMEFKNFWSFGFEVSREAQGISNIELRGGPSIIENGNWSFSTRLSTNSRKKLIVNGSVSINRRDEMLSKSTRYSGGITYRPINSLSISASPSYSISENRLQYVDQTEIENDDRYLFARIDQQTFNLTFTVDYSITPDLSIQYYGSPFVSGGAYSDYKFITEPHAAILSDRYHQFLNGEILYHDDDEYFEINEQLSGAQYNFDKPDFNFRQFRSNMVLRWEYLPGSILFLVWSQGKTGFVSDGLFDLGGDFNDLFNSRGRDIFLVKFSYRFRAEQWR